jgi:hypothetical protein
VLLDGFPVKTRLGSTADSCWPLGPLEVGAYPWAFFFDGPFSRDPACRGGNCLIARGLFRGPGPTRSNL